MNRLRQKFSEGIIGKRLVWIVLFVIAVNTLLFHQVGSLGFVLVLLSMAIVVWGMFGSLSALSKHQRWLSGLGAFILLAFVNILRSANPMVQLISSGLVLSVIVLLVYLLATGISFVRSLGELIMAPMRVFIGYLESVSGLIGLVDPNNTGIVDLEEPQNNKFPIRSILVGLVVGIPIVVVLMFILTGADPIFASFVKSLISQDLLKELPNRLTFSGAVFLILLPLLVFKLSSEFVSVIHRQLGRIGFVVEMSVIMGLVATLFGISLFVQWPYVFASVPAETDLSKYGVATYSEYVRKGFGELLVVATITYGLIWLGLIVSRSANKPKYLLTLQTVVLAEVGLFIISIFRRVWLYQQYHGWSLVRLYGIFFLLWLAGLLITLAWRHYRSQKMVIWESLLTGVVILRLGLFNVEHFIVASHPPTVNNRVDYVYLSRLSSDGFEGWIRSFKYADDVLSSTTLNILDREDRRRIAYAGWIVMNLSDNYHGLIEKYGSEYELKWYYSGISEQMKKLYSRPINPVDANLPSSGVSVSDFNDWQNTRKRIEINRFRAWNNVFGEEWYAGWPSFYVDRRNYNIDLLDNWDRVLLWNLSEARAFQSFQRGITIDKIWSLQQKFFELYSQIRQRSVEERTYDIDISSETPFLF